MLIYIASFVNILSVLIIWGMFISKYRDIHKRFKLRDSTIKVIEELNSKKDIFELFTLDDLAEQVYKKASNNSEIYFFVQNPKDENEPYLSMLKKLLLNKHCKIFYFDFEGSDRIERMINKLKTYIKSQNIERVLLLDEAKILPTNYCFIKQCSNSTLDLNPSIIYSTITDNNNSMFGYELMNKDEKLELWTQLNNYIKE